MFGNPIIIGGDPEGMGFYRTMQGTRTLTTTTTTFTIDCGFTPKSVAGFITNSFEAQPRGAPMSWNVGQQGYAASFRASENQANAFAMPITVSGTKITFEILAIQYAYMTYTATFTITGTATQ